MRLKDKIDTVKANIILMLAGIESERGAYNFWGYIKTNPKAKNGFEEWDCKVELPGLTTRRVRFPHDPDEKLCKEISNKIIKICKNVQKEMPYMRIIITKNGNYEVSIGR